MSVVGIVAEFNPLHKGHEYLINLAKKQGTVVVCISGNFVQRGETAIAEKRIRAKAALKAGADIVLELPVMWSMSTAQNFALGGISALKAAGCDKIMFGCECGDAKTLIDTAEILQTPRFSEELSKELEKGITFAKARQNAAERAGVEKDILAGANNNLAIEYILAAKSLDYSLEFCAVKRVGAQHDSFEEDEFVSASLLRAHLKENDYDFCKKYISEDILSLFSCENISDVSRLERAILSVLRVKNPADFSILPDISEGVENKLITAIKTAKGIDDLFDKIKVKRYTLARIRRLVLSAFIGIDNSFFMKPLPYVRVLGFNKKGEAQLKKATANASIPIITRVSQVKDLDTSSQKVFETECRATDLFLLSLSIPGGTGLEYTSKLIKVENFND